MRWCRYLALLVLPLADSRLPAQPNVTAPSVTYSYDQRLGAQLPEDLIFADETGKEVRLGDYLGKRPILLTIVQYRCPMLCGEVLNGLLECLRGMPGNAGDQFDVLTISFDVRETAELAAAKRTYYLEQYGRSGADAGWHFLTGGPEAIARLTETIGFRFQYIEGTDRFAHPTGMVVLTPDGRASAYLDGIDFPTEKVQKLLDDAREGRIGRPVPIYQRPLLLCYDYNPATGGWSLNVMRAVRLAGALTVLVLAGVIGRAWWNARRLAARIVEVNGARSASKGPLARATSLDEIRGET
jgi:protein SCO1/2